ncbi:MAG TPA: hypothetical protein VGY98_07345, partial [Verrucomicrobiae bacterium]|nr:hypothetical protein [Verrucomicrobiae bacterium]
QPVLPQQVFGLLIILQQFVQYFIGNSHSFLSSQLSLATYTIIFTAPQAYWERVPSKLFRVQQRRPLNPSSPIEAALGSKSERAMLQL